MCQSQTRLGILPSPMSSPLPLVQFHSDFLKYFTPYFNIFRGMDLKLKHCQYWLPDWAVDKEMLTWCQHFCAHLLPKSESCILFAFFLNQFLRTYIISSLRVAIPNRMNFWKNSKGPLTRPLLIFGKLCCNFYIMDIVAFLQGSIGQIVSVNIS